MYDLTITKGDETRLNWASNTTGSVVLFICNGLGIARAFSYDNLLVFSQYETGNLTAGEYEFDITVDGKKAYRGKMLVQEKEEA